MSIIGAKTIMSVYRSFSGNEFSIAPRNKIKILYNQRYSAKDERLLADIYLPLTNQLSMSTVLMIHGGGWASRSKEDMRWIADYYSMRGFVVVNINYRLAPKHLYPAPMDDLKTAFEWMLSNKENFRIDPNKISLLGYSAGGHLASLFSGWVNSNKEGFGHLKHAAVISGGAPMDFMVYPQSPYINRFTSFYRDENPDLYLEASPLSFVSKSSVPHFLYHAEKDSLVEFEQMKKYESKLKENGVKVESYPVKKWDHVGCFLFATDPLISGLKFIEGQVF